MCADCNLTPKRDHYYLQNLSKRKCYIYVHVASAEQLSFMFKQSCFICVQLLSCLLYSLTHSSQLPLVGVSLASYPGSAGEKLGYEARGWVTFGYRQVYSGSPLASCQVTTELFVSLIVLV